VEQLFNEVKITEQATSDKLRWYDLPIMLVLASITAFVIYLWPLEARPQPPQVITLTKIVCLPTPNAPPDAVSPYWSP
jgi:hypothetical protein